MKNTIFISFFLAWVLSAHAQKLQMQHFSDISNAQKMVCYQNEIWLQTSGGLLHLDNNAQILKRYTPLNDSFLCTAELLQGQGGQPILWHNDKQVLMRWDSDKKQWQRIDLPSVIEEEKNNYLFFTVSSHQQQIWLVCESKKVLFLLEDNLWFQLPTPEEQLSLESFLSKTKTGKVWFVGSDKVYIWEGQSWTGVSKKATYSDNFVVFNDSLFNVHHNEIWDGARWRNRQPNVQKKTGTYAPAVFCPNGTQRIVSVYGDSLHLLEGNKWQSMGIPQLLPKHSIKADREYACCTSVDLQGNIWLATNYGSVLRWDGKTWKKWTLPNENPAPSDYVHPHETLMDKDGRIWASLTIEGIYVYDKNRWSHLPDSFFDRNQFTYAYLGFNKFIQSADGNVWAAPQAGAFRQNGNKWDCFFGNVASAFLYKNAQGNVCVTNKEGIHYEVLSNGDVVQTFIPEIKALNLQNLLPVVAPNGDLWFPAKEAFWQYHNGQLIKHQPSTNQKDYNEYRLNLYFDLKGNIYWEINDGFYLLPAGKSNWVLTPMENLDKLVIDAADNVWAVTYQNGISKYQNGLFATNTTLESFNKKERCIPFIDKALRWWLFSEKGNLLVYDTQKGAVLLQTTLPFYISSQNSLLTEDTNGNIWIIGSSKRQGSIKLTLKD